jgi:hypothetical protein
MTNKGNTGEPRRKIVRNYYYAAVPDGMLTDHRVKSSALRLWAILDMFWRTNQEPSNRALAVAMDARPSTIFDLLKNLEATGWLVWHRSNGERGFERFDLVTDNAMGMEVTSDGTIPHGEAGAQGAGEAQAELAVGERLADDEAHDPSFDWYLQQAQQRFERRRKIIADEDGEDEVAG